MSIFHNNVLCGAAGQAGGAAGPIKSVRFNSGDTAYLDRTPSSAGNRKTWTWAGWIKRCGNSAIETIFSAGGSNTSARTNITIFFYQDDNSTHGGRLVVGDGSAAYLRTDARFRDSSGWGHLVIVADTTLSTAADRIKIYWNGVRITDFNKDALSTNVPQNSDLGLNTTDRHAIGAKSYNSSLSEYANLYLADVYFIDGQAKQPTDFGAFDDNGVWQAAAYSGTFGSNGYHLFDFANESGIGDDSSGNDNDFTGNNLGTADGTISSATRFDWETTDSGWSLSDSDYTATNTTSGYRQVYSQALNSSTTYHFILSEKPGDNNGGWFFSSNTSVNDTHPDELSGNTLGLRTGESGIGTSGTFSTANGVSGGQNAITGFSDITTSSGSFHHSEWVINMTARKVWVRSLGSSSWIKGGDPTNSSSTPSFSLPTGSIYFGYVAYSSNETQAKFVTSVPSLALENDISFDVPTNGDSSDDTGAGGEVSGNYATLNSNIMGTYKNNFTLSEGNLKTVHTNYATLPSTLAMKSGKWYCEGTLDALASASNQVWAGLLRTSAGKTDYEYFQFNNPSKGVHYWGDNTGLNRTQSYGVSYATAGTVIGIAFDADAGSCTWYVNGSSQGASTYNIVQGEEYFFSFGAYTNGAWSVNFGARPFRYSAPSGYKTLCTTNLPDPTIADGSTAFDAVTYTGNGSTQTISGLEFSPDLVWIKHRGGAYIHLLFDQIRGTTKYLSSNRYSGQGTDSNSLTAFTSDGFSVGTTNASNQNNGSIVAWAWDAGSSTVSNTDGDVTSSVRANSSAGFSIVKWNPSSNGQSVGHGLNAVPEFIMAKAMDNGHSWRVYHKSLSSNKNLLLDSTDGQATYSADIDTVSSTVFDGGQGLTGSSLNNNIAYCFTSVAGYSAFGSYEGNGSNDGPFVYTGFRPAFIMYKRFDGNGNAWHIFDYKRDGYNAVNKRLLANTDGAETGDSIPDLLSNGFKIRTNSNSSNGNTNDYIWAAFAKNPFSANGGLAR